MEDLEFMIKTIVDELNTIRYSRTKDSSLMNCPLLFGVENLAFVFIASEYGRRRFQIILINKK